MLLSARKSFIKSLYRIPFDFIEETTTFMADKILVNSEFTRDIAQTCFKNSKSKQLDILYPTVDDSFLNSIDICPKNERRNIILSINRFERKKKLDMAIQAFSQYRKIRGKEGMLILAGGYDTKLAENVDYMKELEVMAESLNLNVTVIWEKDSVYKLIFRENLKTDVIFAPSISNEDRLQLLRHVTCVVYTPDKEHFGIVPIECMASGTPLVAVRSGGPIETIIHGQTGFLVSPTIDSFAEHIDLIHEMDINTYEIMCKNAVSHVRQNFSFDVFCKRLEKYCYEIISKKKILNSNMSTIATMVIFISLIFFFP